jgi:hypothetical protein
VGSREACPARPMQARSHPSAVCGRVGEGALGRRVLGAQISITGCFKVCLLFLRTDAILLGHYRLSQDADNQTKVFAVITKKKEEVSMHCGAGAALTTAVHPPILS